MHKGKKKKNSNYQDTKAQQAIKQAVHDERRKRTNELIKHATLWSIGAMAAILAIFTLIGLIESLKPEPAGPFAVNAVDEVGSREIFLTDLNDPTQYTETAESSETRTIDLTKTILSMKVKDAPKSYIKQLRDGMDGAKYGAVVQNPYTGEPFDGSISGLHRDGNVIAIIIGSDLYISADANIAIRFE